MEADLEYTRLSDEYRRMQVDAAIEAVKAKKRVNLVHECRGVGARFPFVGLSRLKPGLGTAGASRLQFPTVVCRLGSSLMTSAWNDST